jgi:hypothetical protein
MKARTINPWLRSLAAESGQCHLGHLALGFLPAIAQIRELLYLGLSFSRVRYFSVVTTAVAFRQLFRLV